MGKQTEKALKENEKNKKANDYLQSIKENADYEMSVEEARRIIQTRLANRDNNTTNNVPQLQAYLPRLTLMLSNGVTYDLIQYTTIVQVEINLEDYVFPLISLRLDVPIEYIPKIQFDDDLTINFELLNNDMISNGTAGMYNTIWNIPLKKVKQESAPIMADRIFYEENDQYIRTAPLELKMIPKECLEISKQLFSGVYSDCSISQLLALISEKFNKDVYIHTPDNNLIYDQIIFPPNNIFYAIEHLDKFYGIYNRGLKMFYGFDQCIIMPTHAYKETGINKIKIDFNNDMEDGINLTNYLGAGIAKLGNDNYISIPPSKVKIYDRRHFVKETRGNIINTFSRDEEQYFEQMRNYDINKNFSSDKPDKVKSYLNRYNNLAEENNFVLDTVYTRQLEINVDNVILNPDSWFKPFDLTFSSENYNSLNGYYSMKGYFFRFVKVNMANGASEYNTYSAVELVQSS